MSSEVEETALLDDPSVEEVNAEVVEDDQEESSHVAGDDAGSGNDGPSVEGDGWDINEFVEEVKEDPNVNFFDQIPGGDSGFSSGAKKEKEEPESQQKETSSGGSTKEKHSQCKIIVDFMDMILAGSCVMIAQDPPHMIDEYRASEEYKRQMAEQMSKCDWSFEIKPEWMLLFIAVMVYMPNLYTAWRKRQKRSDIRKERASDPSSSGSDEVQIHLVEDPVTGEFVEVSKEQFEREEKKHQSSSKASSGGADQHPCMVCGTPTTNPKYCSRKCSAKAMNREKRNSDEVEYN